MMIFQTTNKMNRNIKSPLLHYYTTITCTILIVFKPYNIFKVGFSRTITLLHVKLKTL